MILKRGDLNGNNIEIQLKTRFVDKIKESIKNNDFEISDRSKNKIFMRRFRLNHSSIKEILLSLDYSSFYKIDEDRNKENFGEGPVVILMTNKDLVNFHGEIENIKIYIKLKLIEDMVIPVISFHEAEF